MTKSTICCSVVSLVRNSSMSVMMSTQRSHVNAFLGLGEARARANRQDRAIRTYQQPDTDNISFVVRYKTILVVLLQLP